MISGEGPQPALGMVIGEAPGRDEIKYGRPFVGKAGSLLDTALHAVGIQRDEVYITNVVKELPLDSDGKIRRPTPGEVLDWWPILEGEIASTAPAAILCLGRTAGNAVAHHLYGLEGDVPFKTALGGQAFVAWHPAYLLRGGHGSAGYRDWLAQLLPWAEAVIRA